MNVDWMRSRTPDGRWFEITWDKPPTIDDVRFMYKILDVARSGFEAKPEPIKDVCGVKVVHIPAAEARSYP